MMKCLAITSVVSAVLLAIPTAPAATVIEAERAAVRTEGGEVDEGIWNLWSNGRVGQYVRAAKAGKYQIEVRAYGSPAAGEWPKMTLTVDGRALQTVTVDRDTPADYRFDVELPAEVCELAVAFNNDLVRGQEDRNLYLDRITITAPPDVPDVAIAGRAEIVALAGQHEREILLRCDREIEANRKSNATVRVVDAAGQPVAGVSVQAAQIRHDFLFGCNIYRFDRFKTDADNAAYKRGFEELFNAATVGFYWRSYEPQRGKPQYEYTDKVVAWCAERGIRCKGHPLLWGHEAGIPVWSDGQPAAEIQRQRVSEIIRRYRGRIDFWEVVNEASHIREPKIDQPYRWARAADAKAYLIVNDYYVMADGYPPFFKLLTEAKRSGVPFDGIGIQAHEPRTMRFPLEQVWRILDRYATLGKELHVTEFSPASGGKQITGSHLDGVWDEAAQADYAAKFYRVCFAHPAMVAITWWDLCDNGSWLEGGGMLRADTSPKPVYDELKRLIHTEWKTRTTGRTDAEGRFAFRGFHGTYRISAQVDGKPIAKEFHLTRSGENRLTLP
ncbi:MAG: endo-1,4-beta-xylanase [Candidatus Nealsonbacteria bacterium]|nr:endo-1,4-beta-xylanase [Candidatus Nealsonbacteria bacterium]